MNKVILICRESEIKDRVRLLKFYNYFSNHRTELEIWKKKGAEDMNYSCKFIDVLSRQYSNKTTEKILWIISLCYKLLFRNTKNATIIASDFESALPAATAAIFKRKNIFVFDNTDNAFISIKMNLLLKQFLKGIEYFITRISNVTLIPDQSRIVFRSLEKKYEIIKNFPDSYSHQIVNLEKISPPIKDKLVIYINGYLTPARGLECIERLLGIIPEHYKWEIIIAGKDKYLNTIRKHPKVTYLGQIRFTKSLEIYKKSHVAITLYDPEIEINRIAAPNKWGDCLATETIPVINREVTTINEYFPFGGFMLIDYGDYKQLFEVLQYLTQDSHYEETLKSLKKNEFYYWDTKLTEILNKYVC